MTLYDECVDAAAVLMEMARMESGGDTLPVIPVLDRWEANVEKWGVQPMETLFVVLGEEVGEIARAILEGDGGGDE